MSDSGVSPTPPQFPTGPGGGFPNIFGPQGPIFTPPTVPNAPAPGSSGGGLGTLGNIGTIASIGTGIFGTIAGLIESARRGKLSKEQLKQIEQLGQLVIPFATQLINFGINPAQFLKSPQGQAMLRPVLEASSKEFEGARQSLIDSGAASGFSPSSGMVAGPFANLLSDQAKTASDIRSGQIGQAMNFGIQGSNLIAGQQGAGIPALGAILNSPNVGLQLAGASGQSLNTLLQLMTLFGQNPNRSGG